MKNIFLNIILVLFFISIFLYTGKKRKDEIADLNKEYPLLNNLNSIEGRINGKFDYLSNKQRDPILISLLKIGDKKFKIIAEEIEGFSNLGINEVVSIGDSILKKSMNDTIYIKKQNGTKYTLLRKDKPYEP